MRTGTGTWLLRPALVAGLVLMLGACSDPAPAGTVPKSTPRTATSPPSPSPTPTAIPVEKQVEAAVRTYYAELTKAAQTNDTTRLKQLVHKNCPCYGSVRSIDETATQGRTTPDAAWMVVGVRVHDIVGTTAAAEVQYKVGAYDVMDRSGEVINRIPARNSHVDLSLLRIDRGWILTNVFNFEAK
jgi:hypothetical protein